jgi:hypothetical protein
MADSNGFANTIAHEAGLSEPDIAIAVAWYLSETNSVSDVTLNEVCEFMKRHKLRSNINRSRLQGRLSERRDVSAPKGKSISVRLEIAKKFHSLYGQFLTLEPPRVEDTILESDDFTSARPYVRAVAKQINGCRQFGMYDACAVMMRRLGEILIIDAYEAKGARSEILDGGNYMMMSGLISALTSGKTFKLSRNAPKWLNRLKELGDNAAHSRTYITKEIDIDEFKGAFRNLVSELQGLVVD